MLRQTNYKNCDYCCISTLHKLAPGPKFRRRTIPNIVAEMKYLYQQKGIRQFVFHDDNFLVPCLEQNLKRIEELETTLKKNKICDIGLVLKCSPSDAHPEVLARLKKMGLIRIFMGIESGSKEGLSSLGRRQSIDQEKKALETCRQLGISTQYTLIIFHPDATLQTIHADLDFVRQFSNYPMNYCRAEVYAGTPLERRLLDQNRLYGNYRRYKYDYADPKVQKVWDIAYDLFMGRCWGPDDLLSNMIHLDHQVAVLKHFYEGREAEEIYRSFIPFQEEVNLKTVGLFSELVSYISDDHSPDKLEQMIKYLKMKEYNQRLELSKTACEFRSRLAAYGAAMVELTSRKLKSQHLNWNKGRIPGHAAAVIIALGISSLGIIKGQSDSLDNQQITDTVTNQDIDDINNYDIKDLIHEYRDFDGIREAAAPPDWSFPPDAIPEGGIKGNLTIDSKSSLKVTIDDICYGTTPLAINISPGKYVVWLENAELNIRKKRRIKVKKEGDNSFYFSF